MTARTFTWIGLVLQLGLGFGFASQSSAQIFDGQYWEGAISGKTRTVTAAPGGNLAQRELIKGRLSKSIVYLLSSWDEGSQSYTLDAWTTANGVWVRADDAGTLSPFGDGFPDSDNALIVLTLNLTPTPPGEGAASEVIIDLSGLVTLKSKTNKKVEDIPGVSEVQSLITGDATAGTFSLSFDGDTTAALPYDVTAGALQGALQGLSTIGAGNLLVQQPAAGSYLLTFAGSLALQDVSQILVQTDDTTGGVGVFTGVVTAGMSPVFQSLKSGSFGLMSVGSTMSSTDFAGVGNDMSGNPEFKAKRVVESKLPFVP